MRSAEAIAERVAGDGIRPLKIRYFVSFIYLLFGCSRLEKTV